MRVELTTTVHRQLLKLPSPAYERILKGIESLAKNPLPRQAKKLSGRQGHRLRIGDYRVLYFVDKKKKVVVVLSVAHRREAYKKLF